MKRVCEDVKAALGVFDVCVETDDGARVTTHCMYPSFTPVDVFVVRHGDSYTVHDSGGAYRGAWIHGRDDSVITRMVNRQAQRYRLSVAETNGALVAKVPRIDFLAAAVLAVANASASAAHAAVEKIALATEQNLIERIALTLSKSGIGEVRKDVQIVGKSGKAHSFDFQVLSANDNAVLIDAVSPHHVSISSKYVAFSDAAAERTRGLAVFDKPLANEDVSLLQQVSSLVPVRALDASLKVALRYGT
jgi:hypothetical protein